MGNLKPGDQVIVVKEYGAMPVKCRVKGITPSGKFVTVMDGGVPFTFKVSDGRAKKLAGERKRGDAQLSAYSPETWLSLVRFHRACAQDHQYKQSDAERHKAERHEQWLAEIAEVKSLGDVSWHPLSCCGESKDRVYLVSIPVNPKHNGRKGAYHVAFVRCQDQTDWEAKPEGTVECSVAVIAESSCGFSTTSFRDAESDEAAIWEVVRSFYFGW